jgi:hypothetical protein
VSKELESRNNAMFVMYQSGRSMQDIAAAYGVSRQRAAQIVARFVTDGMVTDDESRSLEYSQLEALQQEMIKEVYAPSPPKYDVKGVMLIDENGEPVRDNTAKFDAVDQYRKLSDSKRRLTALDLPRRKQIAEDEAMRQVREYLANLPRGEVED